MTECDLIEELAAVEHERWAHWQSYLHSQGVRQDDGSIVICKDLVRRWERQISTHYSQLSEKEKQADRDQVSRVIPLIKRYISGLR